MSKALFLDQILKEGEQYAGLVLGQNGEPDHHLIILPGELKKTTWAAAVKWAEAAGGALPSRREQRILFANAKEHFSDAWYWSGEQHAAYADFAWLQDFYDGYQFDYGLKSYEGRARAVRRLTF